MYQEPAEWHEVKEMLHSEVVTWGPKYRALMTRYINRWRYNHGWDYDGLLTDWCNAPSKVALLESFLSEGER